MLLKIKRNMMSLVLSLNKFSQYGLLAQHPRPRRDFCTIRVILFHQLSEIEIVAQRHSDYNSVRGEITLLSGFAAAIPQKLCSK